MVGTPHRVLDVQVVSAATGAPLSDVKMSVGRPVFTSPTAQPMAIMSPRPISSYRRILRLGRRIRMAKLAAAPAGHCVLRSINKSRSGVRVRRLSSDSGRGTAEANRALPLVHAASSKSKPWTPIRICPFAESRFAGSPSQKGRNRQRRRVDNNGGVIHVAAADEWINDNGDLLTLAPVRPAN